ncbi:hypothetical protein [Streptomyces sp. NPDC048172]|uniref:hypothetical protein n=1 Tax=Streptomyces sp. NPDC048172 TaxID=3365505 RepID=UPI00371BCC90
MFSPAPSLSPSSRAGQLADVPVVRGSGGWWLIAASGAVAADPVFDHVLDRHAVDLAAADRAVETVEQG